MRDRETLWSQAKELAQAPTDQAELQKWVDGLHPEEKEELITAYSEAMEPIIRQSRLTWDRIQKALTETLAIMMPTIEAVLEVFDLAAQEAGLKRESIQETADAMREYYKDHELPA